MSLFTRNSHILQDHFWSSIAEPGCWPSAQAQEESCEIQTKQNDRELTADLHMRLHRGRRRSSKSSGIRYWLCMKLPNKLHHIDSFLYINSLQRCVCMSLLLLSLILDPLQDVSRPFLFLLHRRVMSAQQDPDWIPRVPQLQKNICSSLPTFQM